jgi:hypothetical protein
MANAVSEAVDYLVRLLFDDQQAERFTQNPQQELAAQGLGQLTQRELDSAFSQMQQRAVLSTGAGGRSLSNSQLVHGDSPSLSPALPVAHSAAPVPTVIRVEQFHPSSGGSSGSGGGHGSVHPAQHITNNYYDQHIEEGDVLYDNRTITDIDAIALGGDIDFDLDVDNSSVWGQDGAVVAGGDFEDTAVNTGSLQGIQNASGSVDLEDSTIGNGNNVVSVDGDAGAIATGRSSATNVEAEGNALLGSGTMNTFDDVDEVQMAMGRDIRQTGDVDIDADGSGTTNVAIGDGNRQEATTVNDSYNQDNDVEDSYNTEDSNNSTDSHDVSDSYNTETEVETTTSYDNDTDTSYDNDNSWDNDVNDSYNDTDTSMSATQTMTATETVNDSHDTVVDMDDSFNANDSFDTNGSGIQTDDIDL